MMFSKKHLTYKLLSELVYKVKKTTYIAFYAPQAFHADHLAKVVLELSKKEHINMLLIGCFTHFPSSEKVTKYQTIEEVPLTKKIAIYIATEFGAEPWWVDCQKVYFGHGMGPKLNYATSNQLNHYQYSFVASLPTYQAQKQTFSHLSVEKIGLPNTDVQPQYKDEIYQYFNLDPAKKLVVYAPSWCAEPQYIAPISEVLTALSQLDFINVIVSPHPLLLNPDRCGGNQYFVDLNDNIRLNDKGSEFSTLTLCANSDAVISDISSVFFEAMSLGTPCIFDGNDALYEYCDAAFLLPKIYQACYHFNYGEVDEKLLGVVLSDERDLEQQEKFIKQYAFNIGTATKVFCKKILDIIGYESA